MVADHTTDLVCTDDPAWISATGYGCAEYSSAGTSHAFCNADSDLGIDERLPATACQLACDSCFQTCSTCISSGQPVRTHNPVSYLVVMSSVSSRIVCPSPMASMTS